MDSGSNLNIVTEGAESATEFWSVFTPLLDNTKTKINECFKDDEESAKLHISSIKEAFKKIQKYATLSAIALPSYDNKRIIEILENTSRVIKDLELKYFPRQGFKFTSTKYKREDHFRDQSDSVEASVKLVETKFNAQIPSGSLVFIDRFQENFYLNSQIDTIKKFELKENQLNNISLYIKSNKDCKIYIPWVTGSIRIEDIQGCSIFLGPCCTSVYLENARDSTLFIMCHQLRIHNSSNCCLFVKANSHPIIEDCSEMGFAPYMKPLEEYPQFEEDKNIANLKDAECWDNVVDFRWHKSTASPNWYVIPEEKRALLHNQIKQN